MGAVVAAPREMVAVGGRAAVVGVGRVGRVVSGAGVAPPMGQLQIPRNSAAHTR